MGRTPDRSFDGEDANVCKAGLSNFCGQILRAVEVGGGEVIRVVRRVVVATRCQILRHDFAKVRISKESPGEAVDQRSETRNCSCEKHTVRLQNAPGFAQRLQAIRGRSE